MDGCSTGSMGRCRTYCWTSSRTPRRSQWRVLRPFARQGVQSACERGRGRSFFGVGDVKQAIYGWRGGVAEIFEALDEELGACRRSRSTRASAPSPAVIDCVNQVFTGIAANAVLSAKYPAAAAEMVGALRAAHHGPHALPGYCRMIAAPQAGEGQAAGRADARIAADEVVRLHQQGRGWKSASWCGATRPWRD